MKRKKVVVAMSGGVDSSVAAAILKEEGHEVIGVTMSLFSLPEEFCRSANLRSCCGWKATEDAHRVAMALGIPHYVANLKKSFERKVVENFCGEYARGRTPNPCIRCNQHIKFGALLRKLRAFDADYLATGHHARISRDERSGRFLLKKGKDREKDQSYFLYPLTQDQLSRTLMPVGHLTKQEVREKAGGLGLPVAQRPESQEICFVPDGDYPRFVESRKPEVSRSGPITDLDRRVLGHHRGIIHYTVGQRRGMGIASPHPLYILSILADANTIVVGPEEKLLKKRLIASEVNLISLAELKRPLRVKARIRSRHREASAVVGPLEDGRLLVEFEKPQRAVTPGQSVVFYEGEVVVGGGIIDEA